MCIELANGIAYYWICCDLSGRLAAFTSGSMARIPAVFAENLDQYERVIRPLAYDISEKLPVRSEFKTGPFSQPTDSTIFSRNLIQLDASKGLYTYDMAPGALDAEYYLVYIPENPTLLQDLSSVDQSCVGKFRVSFQFPDAPKLKKQEIVRMFS